MHIVSRHAEWKHTRALIRSVLVASLSLILAAPSPAQAAPTTNELWRDTIERVSKGEFDQAMENIRNVDTDDASILQVRTWLEEYEAKQAARRELNRVDFEKYVGYAKARIEREEFSLALGWALWALDTAEDKDAFLSTQWLLDLVNDSLVKAEKVRREDEWRQAWRIYSQLASLYEREPRYEKLERGALTHLRLEGMFGENSHWDERIRKVRWGDAKKALKEIDRAYVQPADFRRIAESGLEQMLLLADSKSARELEEFKGLADEADRNDFKARVQKRLDRVRSAAHLDLDVCVEHFWRVVKDINPQTVRLPKELIVSELMRGALDPLDDFTTIIWPSATEEFDKHTRGDFVGVGISITKNRADEIEVVTPLDGGPAYRQGIQAGDIITDVDGISLKGFSINKVVETITGDRGTPVMLTIRRDKESLDFDLIRENVKIQSVKGYRRDPVDEERWDHWLDRDRRIGYIRMTNFARNTFDDVQETLSELVGVKGLILDLRGNPGGLLDSAWNVASLFLKRGDVVVSTKGRIEDDNHTFRANITGSYADFPLIILVDDRSASASEIVSGTIRDNGRGTVVGERTFGKFSVQNLVTLSRSGAKLKVTTAAYYLPNGDSLHRGPTSETWGVMPAISVPLVNKERVKVWQMRREADLLGPPKATAKAADAGSEDEEGEEADKSEEADETEEDGEEKTAVADADSDKEDDEESKLPPLDQPDENDRPKIDLQLDTALLLLRVALIGEQNPTLAVAEAPRSKDTAKP